MQRMMTIARMTAAVLLPLCGLLSCSRVSYDYVDDVNHSSISYIYETPILFSFDLDELEDQVPSNMTVLMSRITNTVHYAWWFDSDGNIVEKPESGETGSDDSSVPDNGDSRAADEGSAGDGQTEDGDTPSQDGGEDAGNIGEEQPSNPNIRQVRNGEYYILAIAHGNADYRYRIDGIEEFAANPQVKMLDIEASIPELTKEELAKFELEKYEFNPVCPFIHPADPLYFCVNKEEIRMYPGIETNYLPVKLAPGKKTLELVFKVRLEVEDGVEISNVRAVMSGVPKSIQLMSGKITAESARKTGKTYFDMDAGEDGVYEGHVSVLGLFPSDSEDNITGAGILQLFVNAEATDVNGNNRERSLHASLNIQNVINKADLMEMVDEDQKSGYRCKSEHNPAVLEVPNVLKITKSQVLSENGQGLVDWKENGDDINVDL